MTFQRKINIVWKTLLTDQNFKSENDSEILYFPTYEQFCPET